jgi:hypothetical protein
MNNQTFFQYLLAAALLLVTSPALICGAEKQAITYYKDPAALLTNEVSRIDNLIFYTQKSLDQQKKLRDLIVEYKTIQEQYLKKTQDNDLLIAMVKSAHRTLRTIEEYHLTQTFDPEFIEELTVLSLKASKRGAPKTQK